jgi:prolyl-tRNA synthetase
VQGPLKISKGIEVGHIFKLGFKYTKSLGVSVLGSDGKQIVPTMGCYGIGVDRTLAAVIEQYNDADGIMFPISCAPFSVMITPVDFNEKDQQSAAVSLHDELEKQGIDVLLDDRDQRPGFKFKDADLLGIPLRITIGPKFLKEGKAEIRSRKSKEVTVIPLKDMADSAALMVRKLWEELK